MYRILPPEHQLNVVAEGVQFTVQVSNPYPAEPTVVHEVGCLIDCGSTASFASSDLLRKLNAASHASHPEPVRLANGRVVTALPYLLRVGLPTCPDAPSIVWRALEFIKDEPDSAGGYVSARPRIGDFDLLLGLDFLALGVLNLDVGTERWQLDLHPDRWADFDPDVL